MLSIVPGESITMRTTPRRTPLPEVSIAWRHVEYAALRAIAEVTCDDRVSADILDVEDEYAEVGIILHRALRDLNEPIR